MRPGYSVEAQSRSFLWKLLSFWSQKKLDFPGDKMTWILRQQTTWLLIQWVVKLNTDDMI